MVKFIKPAALLYASYITALKTNLQECPAGVARGEPCGEFKGRCIHEENNKWYCDKRKYNREIVQQKLDAQIARSMLKSDGGPFEDPMAKNTFTYCQAASDVVIYREGPDHREPEITKCFKYNDDGDEVKVNADKFAVNGEVCEMRCPDPQMDPHFHGIQDKAELVKGRDGDNRVYQVTCMCGGDKSEGYCGWKSSGSGSQNFAGGNIQCRYTSFALKQIFIPSSKHDSDIEILEVYSKTVGKARLDFNQSNFAVKYVTEEKYQDDGKTKKRYVDHVPGVHSYWDDENEMKMFPTDMEIENDKGKLEEINVRAVISCRAHEGTDRFMFVLKPWCKNKRHTLKKGRPGKCEWRIEEYHPNPESTFTDDRLGFDPKADMGKPSKYRSKDRLVGLKGKNGKGAVKALMMPKPGFRCPDYLEMLN